MTKQDIIREGIAQDVRLGLCVYQDLQSLETYDKIADVIIKRLHYQGLEIVKYPKQGDDLTGTHIVWSEPLIGG